MAFINGYKFTTKKIAIDAQNLCNAYYGIPQQADDVTKNWCDYKSADFDVPKFWYIEYDISLIPILGNPYIFEVTIPTPVV